MFFRRRNVVDGQMAGEQEASFAVQLYEHSHENTRDQLWELSSFSEAAIGSPRYSCRTAAPASQPR